MLLSLLYLSEAHCSLHHPYTVGKWDVGMATPEHTPIGRGYESFVGYYTHANDFWNKGMGKPEDGEAFAIVGEVGADYVTRRASLHFALGLPHSLHN